MSKKKPAARQPRGAASIGIVEDAPEENNGQLTDDVAVEMGLTNGHPESETKKPKRKAKAEPQASGDLGIADIRKAAAFVNSIGGLDKALALLQILKVAKDVQ